MYLEECEEKVEFRAPRRRAAGEVEQDLILIDARRLQEGRGQLQGHGVRDADHGRDGPGRKKNMIDIILI